MSEPTREQPAVTPEVSTRSPWHVSRIPAHLGRARTSTVVLAVLFLAIFALYLYIRPDTTGAATAGTGTSVPAGPTAPASRPAPTTTPAPETTQDRPTPTDQPTTTGSATEVPTPTETSTTGGTSGLPTSVPPTTTAATSPSG